MNAEWEYLNEFPQVRPRMLEHKFKFELTPGVQFTGVIDRVDWVKGSDQFLIADYKTGSVIPSSKSVMENEVLQLPLYLHAVTKESGGDPIGAYYLPVGKLGRKDGLYKKEFNRSAKSTGETFFAINNRSGSLQSLEKFSGVLENALIESQERVSAIRSGHFPVAPLDANSCERCNVRPVCRIREREDDYDSVARLGTYQEFLGLVDRVRGLSADPVEQEAVRSVEFSEEQEVALSSTGKLVFLEASAGSGKTTILVERYIRSLTAVMQSQDLSPRRAVERILAVTFTEKSAQEMKERVSVQLCEKFGVGVASRALKNIGTIHGLNRRILLEYPDIAGLNPLWEVMDETEADGLRRETLSQFFLAYGKSSDQDGCLNELFESFSRKDIADIMLELLQERSFISMDSDLTYLLKNSDSPKNDYIVPEDRHRTIVRALFDAFSIYCTQYDSLKHEQSKLDFNDLERLSLNVLKKSDVARLYRDRYEVVLVDEFQDTNRVQRELIRLISKPGFSNVFMVGDAKQSIYRFRGADVAVFQQLHQEAEQNGIVCSLNKNFRSQGNIVDFVNRVSQKMFPKSGEDAPDFEARAINAEQVKEPGNPVTVLQYRFSAEFGRVKADDRRNREAKGVAFLINELISEGESLSDIAILFGKISGNEVFLEELESAGIPFIVTSGSSLFLKQPALDGIALLRSLSSDENRLALATVLRSPWFKFEDRELDQFFVDKESTPWEKLKVHPTAAWLLELKDSVTYRKPSEILSIAYSNYPPRGIRSIRLLTEKMVALVSKFESKEKDLDSLVLELSTYMGWERESECKRESVIPAPTSKGAIRVSTVHAAKGLEFPITILPTLDGKGKLDQSLVHYEPGLGIAVKVRGEDGAFIREKSYEELGAAMGSRDDAERRRLFYVALTRAERRMFLVLEDAKRKPGAASKSWGDWLHATDWEGCAVTKDLPETGEISVRSTPEISSKSEALLERIERPSVASGRVFSVTELASHVFCPEFYRKKFVQRWEDRVVEIWPKEQQTRTSPKKNDASALLRKLKISNKERGIALHRVLERHIGPRPDQEQWQIHLKNSYVAQGISEDSVDLEALVDLDCSTLTNFLASEAGQKLFASEFTAYVEWPFQWERGNHLVSGTVDRVVRISETEWVVADYKSSSGGVLESRYTFQVEGYALALQDFWEQRTGMRPTVHAWLIDLLESTYTAVPVAQNSSWGMKQMEQMEQIIRRDCSKENKTVSGVVGTESCTRCPYSSHCTIGMQYMINFF